MPSCNDHVADPLPLVVVSGGSRDVRRTALEGVLRYCTDKALAVLSISGRTRTYEKDVDGGSLCHYIVGEKFWQDFQGEKDRRMLVGMIRMLAFDHDLVVAEVDDDGKEVCIELFADMDEQGMPIFEVLPADGDVETLARIGEWLAGKTGCMPVWGCLLIGGQSRRMGRPKQLLTEETGVTWAEKLVGVLRGATKEVVVAGAGALPDSLAGTTRLADIDGISGPLAGILAAMRWNPGVSWIVCACDMPFVERRSLKWLLAQRTTGVWGVVPYDGEMGRYQPLLAYYDRRARHLFEKMALEHSLRIGGIVAHEKICTPALPEELKRSWQNCNSPDDLGALT